MYLVCVHLSQYSYMYIYTGRSPYTVAAGNTRYKTLWHTGTSYSNVVPGPGTAITFTHFYKNFIVFYLKCFYITLKYQLANNWGPEPVYCH